MASLKHIPSTSSLSSCIRQAPTQEELTRLSQDDRQRGTVLYLAYGSNLSAEKFRGSRGITPLSQVNVQVPSLRLTFDLPGVPYTEPCFANSGRRDPDKDRPRDIVDFSDETKGSAVKDEDYHKDNWHKGLIGVVYEVTPEDYAHIIATEGGGSGYQDILVDCHPFATSNPKETVPQTPTTTTFKAHTLFAPAPRPGEEPPKHGGRLGRQDPSYAQPSARYLKLITDGAAELNLPYEYQDYLHSIRPFRITTARQRAGQLLLVSTWVPIIMFIFTLGRIFADEKGLNPLWLRQLSGAVFRAVWQSYDLFFKPIFGEGERSIPDGGHVLIRSDYATYDYEKSIALTGDNVLIRDIEVEQVATQSLI
ncbi:hypothetical protein AMS68_005636 [Peltaster fructicola]|uniref:gamma-glutamylcyclotransferase n=1 Tax=Peltaster fructicola TaxID=286661 RepID=A0A6H0XZS4_9PEZI|nr:hypothetical protein AMS68_005636 [Peltaster fructicola]